MKEKSLTKVISRKGGLRKSSEIKTPERLLSILDLEDALWTATGVDIEYLAMDKRFLSYLDSDDNGRILCGEARTAIRYLDACLSNLSRAFDRTETLTITELRTDTAESRALADAILRMHSVMRAWSDSRRSSHDEALPSAPRAFAAGEEGVELDVSLAEVELCRRILMNRPVSVDGVVLPDAADDPALRSFLEEIIRSVGGEPHPGGGLGVNIPELDEFLEEARLRLEWLEEAEANPVVLIFGQETAKVYACWEGSRSQLAEYFELDALVAIDPALAREAAKIPLEAYHRALAEDPDNLSRAASISRAATPLAVPDGCGILDISLVRDPASNARIAEVFRYAGMVLRGNAGLPEHLSRLDFETADKAFDPYRLWLAAERGQRLAHLRREQLVMLTSGSLAARARELVGERGAAALAADDIRTVERFLLFKRDLVFFLNNFVVFPYLHDPVTTAAFESGTFIADGRHFSFSVRVRNIARHKVSANYSRMYVMYLEVYIGTKSAYHVAVPVTTGSQGRLYKGKHGLFREPDGTERDAVIVDLLENPISTLETLGMPFRKAYKTVASRLDEMSRKAEERLARSAAEKTDAAFLQEMKTASPEVAAQTGRDHESASPKTARALNTAGGTPRSRAVGIHSSTFGGLVAGGSIAVAALGSSVAFISKTLSEMSSGAVLATIGALGAAILVPVLASALFKLAARDLAPLLEASGIAMNRGIRLSRRQAKAFTVSPKGIRSRYKSRIRKERASRS